MDLLIHSSPLPGSDNSHEFEGTDYGAGLTLILVDVETGRPTTPQAAEVGAPFGVLNWAGQLSRNRFDIGRRKRLHRTGSESEGRLSVFARRPARLRRAVGDLRLPAARGGLPPAGGR